MGSLLYLALPCRPLATLPMERGPTEARPGRKAGTDRSSAIERSRLREFQKDFRRNAPGRVAPRGREPMAGWGGLGYHRDRVSLCSLYRL
jgi:hypothetical protein